MTAIVLRSAVVALVAAVIAAAVWELGTLAVAYLLMQRAIAANTDSGLGAVSVIDLSPFAFVVAFGVAFWLTFRRLRRRLS